MKRTTMSLKQLLGNDYIDTVCRAGIVLEEIDENKAQQIVNEQIEFINGTFIQKNDGLLKKVGEQIMEPIQSNLIGAPTEAFKKATIDGAAPVGGFGCFRLGENGKLYLISKSEHYHTPLGHNFPGYKLIDSARRLGITNATHNNTRGYITRLLETELVRVANGIEKDNVLGLEDVISSKESHVLNRVINLETGSLACEAGIKMMLARFYKLESGFTAPKYSGKIPVFFVMGDNGGGGKANYHGTTIVAQTMRDMWPEIYEKMEGNGIYKVVPIQINNLDDFKTKVKTYCNEKYHVAGFIHEIVLMNYGGIRLTEEFLQGAYEICHENDIPTMCDEIQSCMWYKGMFLFRWYGLNPDFVIIGKGFPGGQYAASRIITTYEMDSLNQFGALVTNGQEELAALAYLITMKFAEDNGDYIQEMGEYYENRVRELVQNYSEIVDKVEGLGLLMTMFFKDEGKAVELAKQMNAECIDISAQTYKAQCPPAVLTKLPIIVTKPIVDFLIEKLGNALERIKEGK